MLHYANAHHEEANQHHDRRCDLCCIYGENDRALPDVAKTMQSIQRAHPQAELTALPNCGHFLQEDEPDQLAQLMAEFLNR